MDLGGLLGGMSDDQKSGLLNLGLGLMSGSAPHLYTKGNMGEALSGAVQNFYGQQQAKQNLRQGDLANQMSQQKLAMMQAAMQQYLGPQSGQPQGAPPMAPPQGPQPPPGIAAPQGGGGLMDQSQQPPQQAQAPQGAPSWLNPPSPDQLRSQPIGGINPNYYRAMAMVNGKDPLTADKEIEDRQRAGQQEQYAPILGKLETIIKSDKPSQYINSDQSLKAAWNTIAPQLGFTKPSDFTDQNIRTALTYGRNQLATSIGLPAMAPNVPLQQGRDAASGLNYEVDPVTQKRTYAPAGPNVVTAEDKIKNALAQREFDMKQSRYGVPEGYERAPTSDNPTAVRPIQNGPHDPLAVGSGMGNRGEVMFNRVVNAGNSAAESAKNISELPMGASKGWLGYGASSGTGILSSVKDGLTKTLSSQETQDYNVMLSGVSRNLAALETSGLAPGGSLTHSMDALAVSPGDTRMTVLRKQAEMRQIVETNLASNLVNPKIPEPQKQFVRDIITKIQTAIPYTNADVTQFEQSKNPRATIMDFAHSTVAKPLAPGDQQSLGKFTVTRVN